MSECENADQALVGGRDLSPSAIIAGSKACAPAQARGAAGSPHPEAQALPLMTRAGQMSAATWTRAHQRPRTFNDGQRWLVLESPRASSA